MDGSEVVGGAGAERGMLELRSWQRLVFVIVAPVRILIHTESDCVSVFASIVFFTLQSIQEAWG